jgi:hypothetical protein
MRVLPSRRSLTVIAVGVAAAGATFLYYLIPVPPHTRLIFATPRSCLLYVPYSTPENFQFIGNNLSQKIEDRSPIYDIIVPGTGTIKYQNVKIDVTLGGIRVGDQVLGDRWCSYVLDRSGRIKLGQIRTAW